MSGPVGVFYRQFAITMATAIILGIVALTLTPALCAIMLKTIMKAKKKTPINRFVDGFNNTFNLAQGKYQNLLGKIINRRAITFIALVVF
jgi:HAE1 family hydrophobic/amphiphilic exporter-1